MGHLVVVNEVKVARSHGEIMAKFRVVRGRIQGIKAFEIPELEKFADPLMARFDPVAHVERGRYIRSLAEDRKAVGTDRGPPCGGTRRQQVAMK